MSVLAAADALCNALRGFDVRLLTGADAARVAARLAETAKACTAAGALAAARAVDAGAHKDSGAKDGATWFAQQSGSTPNEAQKALGTARTLELMPDTKDALLAGEISMAQASEIAQAEAETPGAEHVLLPTAKTGDLAQVKQHARDHRQAHTPVQDLHQKQLDATDFRYWTDSMGMICGRFALPPEWGIPLMNRVERGAGQLRRAARRAGAADRRFNYYQAQALSQLSSGAGEPTSKSGRSTDLIIVCDLNAWRRGFARPGQPCHIIGGGPIPVELAKELAEDAFLKVALHDGVALHTISHPGRRHSAHLRTALDLGVPPDFGGRACSRCGQRWGLQTDHIDPVAHQGHTEYTNLQPLCWTCHEQKTERDRESGLLGPHARARPPNPS